MYNFAFAFYTQTSKSKAEKCNYKKTGSLCAKLEMLWPSF